MPLLPDRALKESAAAAIAHRASTVVMLALTLATTLAVLLTAGRSAAIESEVLARIDQAGTRLITVQVLSPAPGIDQAGLHRLSRATGVQWALGLGEARDIRNPTVPGGPNVAARTALTPLPDVVNLETGRAPGPGEAVVSQSAQETLGLRYPSGTLEDGGRSLAVVGEYAVADNIAGLERLVLVGSSTSTVERATLVYLLADSVINVPTVTAAIPALAGGNGPEGMAISTSEELLTVQQAVGGQLSSFGRTMAGGALVAGLVLMTLAVTLALSNRRRDHGRRRALGASRSAIVVLAVLEVLIPVLVGTCLGTAVGALLVHRLTGQLPGLDFLLAVPVLIIISGIVATLPPATAAAFRDPVQILRVP